MDIQTKKQTMINKIKNLARVIKCYDCMTNDDYGNCEECKFYISPNREILALEYVLEELKGE